MEKNVKEVSFKKIFEDLSKIDVSPFLDYKDSGRKDKRGETIFLSYLSWPQAIRILTEYDDDFNFGESFKIQWYNKETGAYAEEGQENAVPYYKEQNGSITVKGSLTIKGKTVTETLYPYDNSGNDIKTEAYTITDKWGKSKYVPEYSAGMRNKTEKRLFVKLAALFGLGLNVFAGDENPFGGQVDPNTGEVTEYTPSKKTGGAPKTEPYRPNETTKPVTKPVETSVVKQEQKPVAPVKKSPEVQKMLERPSLDELMNIEISKKESMRTVGDLIKAVDSEDKKEKAITFINKKSHEDGLKNLTFVSLAIAEGKVVFPNLVEPTNPEKSETPKEEKPVEKPKADASVNVN